MTFIMFMLGCALIWMALTKEFKDTMAAYKRDGERIKELREKIRNLTIIGLGNL